jgi:cytochrome oxidase Cu insertion factor (SCO1/SenC/PrrC family)
MAKRISAGRIKVIYAFLLLFGPALILIFLSTRGCQHKFKELDDYGEAVNYTFTDAQGEKHSSTDFKDKIVLINVIQETCPDSCSVSMWHLDQLIYQKIRKNKNEVGAVRIVSFVTDGNGEPVDDLTTVNKMLNDRVEGYDPEVWMVASGDSKSIYDFEHNGESLIQTGDEYFGGEGYQELMLLLDRKNHLRMVLSGKTEGMIRRMYQHIALLLKQYDKEAARKK